MSYVLAFLISLLAGWSGMAAEALVRAEARPGMFAGKPGMVVLMLFYAAGALLVAGGIVWILKMIPTSAVFVLIAAGAVLGGAASNRLHVNAAGAANRLILGVAGLMILYGLAWAYFPPP